MNKIIRIISLIGLLVLIIGFSTAPTFAYDAGVAISIPSIDVNAPIVTLPIRDLPHGRTWDTSGLSMAVGYMEHTAWFGQGGNVVLGGHSELGRGQADIFYHLDQVAVGDEIIIYLDGSERRYVVASVFSVDQNDVSIVRPTPHEQLTIMTCDLESFDSGNYNNRVVVVAYPA